jgi:hypothetical protein
MTFWCQKLAVQIVLESSEVIKTVKYVTIWCQKSHRHKRVTTGNCRGSYIALDQRLNWVVIPRKWNKQGNK